MTATRTASHVVLIGGNSIIREGLRSLLSAQNRRIIHAGSSIKDLAALSHPDPNFLLLLIEDQKSEWDGNALAAIHRRHPGARIAILAHRFDYQAMLGAFRAGIEGYLTNDLSWERLAGYLDLIELGEKIFPSQLAQKLIDETEPCEQADMEEAATVDSANLSAREMDILRRLIAGLPNKVISRQLAISEATVKVHVKAVLRKLRVANRTQAAIWAAGQGIHGLDAPPSTALPKTEAGAVAATMGAVTPLMPPIAPDKAGRVARA